MSLNWSVLSGSLSTSKTSMYDSIYSATYSYSQTKALNSAYTALKSGASSAKNSKEAAKIADRLNTLTTSFTGKSSSVDPYAAWKTNSGSSKISDLAKEAGKKMYEETTGKGTVVDEEV